MTGNSTGKSARTSGGEPGISRPQGTVRGADGQPLESELVRLTGDCGGPEQRVVTGSGGTYEFFTVEDRECTLEATREGYGNEKSRIQRKTTLAISNARKPGAAPQKIPAAKPKASAPPLKIAVAPPEPKVTAADLSL